MHLGTASTSWAHLGLLQPGSRAGPQGYSSDSLEQTQVGAACCLPALAPLPDAHRIDLPYARVPAVAKSVLQPELRKSQLRETGAAPAWLPTADLTCSRRRAPRFAAGAPRLELPRPPAPAALGSAAPPAASLRLSAACSPPTARPTPGAAGEGATPAGPRGRRFPPREGARGAERGRPATAPLQAWRIRAAGERLAAPHLFPRRVSILGHQETCRLHQGWLPGACGAGSAPSAPKLLLGAYSFIFPKILL